MSAPAIDVCPQGHELTDPNSYPDGTRRRCKECRRQQRRDAAQRRRQAEFTATAEVRLVAGPGDSDTPIGDWQERAACRNAPSGVFFPNEGEAGIPTRARRAATLYCARCPVLDLCDQEATNRRDIGLWAGAWRERGKSTAVYRVVSLLATGEES